MTPANVTGLSWCHMTFRPLEVLRLLVIPLLAGPVLRATASTAEEFFENRIRPVFADHCHDCHSTSTKTQGGLSLDSRADLLKGGDSGPAIVPGQPESSLLLAAVRHQNADLAMPAKRPKLPDSVLQDLQSWIQGGASWPSSTHAPKPAASFDLAGRKARLPWLWETPRRQAVPPTPAKGKATTDVDRFLLAKLTEKNIPPAPPTDEHTWLRRVFFTITGLPPAPEAIHAFIADPDPEKRERLVDGLLSSPHYGERWARHWMDLVRYAESRGHESDFPIANAWQYRDYLVRAFNADLPYDRFVSEHLAGDLLPPRLQPGTGANDAVLGTGWAFLGEEVHSPVDIRQDECERVDNKIDVLSKTFLGLTLACARCHDHKFDAISQRDYYAMAGFILGSRYRQVRFETMEEHARTAADLEALRNRFRSELAVSMAPSLESEISRLLQQLRAVPQSLEAAASLSWLLSTNLPSHPLRLFAQIAKDPATLQATGPAFREPLVSLQPRPVSLPADAKVIADFTAPGRTPWKTDGPGFGTRPVAIGEVILGSSPTNPVLRVMPYGAARRDAFWNRLANAPGNESESGSVPATTQAGRILHTPTLTLTSGRLHYLIRGKARVYAAVDSHLMLAGPLHGVLVTTFDGGPEPSWVTHHLEAYTGHRAHLEFSPEGDGDLEVLQVVEAAEPPRTTAVDLWFPRNPPSSWLELVEAFAADSAEAVRRLQKNDLASDPRLAALADGLLRNRSLSTGATNAASTKSDFFREQEILAQGVRWHSRTAVAWFDGTGVDERVLSRGKPTKPGDPAPRALPAAFGTPTVTANETSGREELARQLVDPSNPLVARVIVNRVWQHVFGRGIVGTPDNFGYLGERPTHPELLDHLAWQFVHEDAWSLKRLIKRLVLTDAFARSSVAATGRAAEVDPSNLLLHRMPVRRLEAEVIRDAVLAVSGRLDPRLGGPPVPVHLTDFIIGRGRPERSGPLDGDGRRSVYTAVPRNFLPTMMVAFDYPTPFSTVGRRNTTNVPGQPLTLMNDPFLHDQARFWANRVLRTLPGATEEARARWMFETAFARPATDHELQVCLNTLGDLRRLHASADEASAWTDLAHALFNANEFIYLN
ncbi:MAG: PSD1 domain-containing protein [Verrucomicrobiales bacterium]|nr:PSD1 domain-containing protein [Verrucomicrobiales bacterium]